jgi:hypothetical protein
MKSKIAVWNRILLIDQLTDPISRYLLVQEWDRIVNLDGMRVDLVLQFDEIVSSLLRVQTKDPFTHWYLEKDSVTGALTLPSL